MLHEKRRGGRGEDTSSPTPRRYKIRTAKPRHLSKMPEISPSCGARAAGTGCCALPSTNSPKLKALCHCQYPACTGGGGGRGVLLFEVSGLDWVSWSVGGSRGEVTGGERGR